MNDLCPVCKSTVGSSKRNSESRYYSCPRCGEFTITEEAFEDRLSIICDDNDKIALLSYEIRKMQRDGDVPVIKTDLLELLLKKELPGPAEQMDNFIMWLGNSLSGIGDKRELMPYDNHLSVMGAKTVVGFFQIINYLEKEGLLQNILARNRDSNLTTLSIPGWEFFEELKRGAKDSRRAFMAMKFGDDQLDKIVEEYFKPAVNDTGFALITLNDVPAAGLIDDRMRVEIRKSRFLIADLTHENKGAYWESGFAEGLEKPVIYTCEKSKWEDEKSHFDTNHLLTVLWDKDNPTEAVDKLKVTIRATLPSEAKLSDD